MTQRVSEYDLNQLSATPHSNCMTLPFIGPRALRDSFVH
jgi:hypothetical protein